jgi:dipeptidyl aminopeptidase/acylaminoacyl peptidase
MSDGLDLYGEVYIPRGERTHPALCICHGIPATPYDPSDKGYAVLAERFCRAGFVTLIFNFRGAGKSQGNLDLLGWSRDLKVAVDFLYNLGETDRTDLCLLGFSGGAAVSVYATAHDQRISSLTACACPADFNSLTDNETASSAIQHFRDIGVIRDDGFPASMETWLNNFETVSPIRWVDKVSPRPLLLVHGDADEVVPSEHAYRLYQKAREPKELLVIPGAKHRLRLEEKAMAAILDCLKATCQI